MLRFMILAALLAVAAADYCDVCSDHTMCLYKTASSTCKGHATRTLTASAKKAAVDAHNKLRNLVALGKETRGLKAQPSAANMRKMTWNTELANIAQRWASQCKFEHDKCRNKADKTYVGQNIYWMASSKQLSAVNWTTPVQSWYDEVDLRDGTLNVQGFKSSAAVGHFTQVVWANTHQVGCGYADYQEVKKGTTWYSRLIVCNYAPGGNIIGQNMYTSGKAASQCPTGTKKDTTYTGLCAISA